MNDLEYEETKARVMEVVERWRYALGLNMWLLHMEWNRTEKRSGTVGWVAGEATADWRYQEATIEWYLPVVMHMDAERLEYVVLHELGHLLLNEMRESGGEGGIDHEERVVTQVAKALQWARDGGREGGLAQPAPADVGMEAV